MSYKELRQHNIPAHIALRRTKYKQNPKTLPKEVNGFLIVVETHFDPDPDISHLGRFSNYWSKGAIHVPESRYNKNIYKWFIPAISYKETYQWYSKQGYCKHDCDCIARKYQREDMRKAGEYKAYIVKTKAIKCGVILGEDSIGGCELENEQDMVNAVFNYSLIDEAIIKAEKTLKQLCECENVKNPPA